MSDNTDIIGQMKVEGHLEIKDEYDNIILTKKNSIHFENFSLAIAESMCKQSVGPIKSMAFGNGGSTLSGVGTVSYFSTNTIGSASTLYNKTYEKVVNNLDSNNTDPVKNKLSVSHINGNLFSDIIITCTLEYSEPLGQGAIDNTTDINGTFVFDEIGIMNYDDKLLTHVIFSPVEKSTNRIFSISYTIRCQMV